MTTLFKAIAQVNGYSDTQCQTMDVTGESWFHITRYGGYHAPHNHPMASWSGVYMVNPGDDADDSERGGVLSFQDPRPHAN